MIIAWSALWLLSWFKQADPVCSPTSYYRNCWIRRFPGLYIAVEESQRRGAALLQLYQEESALKCSRACCLATNFSCNLAVYHYNTTQDSANCFHLHCPTLESCILRPRGNVILYNVTQGVDPDLLVFGKHFTSNFQVLPNHASSRLNISEPFASDKRQFNRPHMVPSSSTHPESPATSAHTSTIPLTSEVPMSTPLATIHSTNIIPPASSIQRSTLRSPTQSSVTPVAANNSPHPTNTASTKWASTAPKSSWQPSSVFFMQKSLTSSSQPPSTATTAVSSFASQPTSGATYHPTTITWASMTASTTSQTTWASAAATTTSQTITTSAAAPTAGQTTAAPTTDQTTTASPAAPTTGQTTTASPAAPTTGQTTTASTAAPTDGQTTTASPAAPTTGQTTTASPAAPTDSQTTTASPAAPTDGQITTASTAAPTTSQTSMASTTSQTAWASTTSQTTTASPAAPTTNQTTTASPAVPTTNQTTTASPAAPTTSQTTSSSPTAPTTNQTTMASTTSEPAWASTTIQTTWASTTKTTTSQTTSSIFITLISSNITTLNSKPTTSALLINNPQKTTDKTSAHSPLVTVQLSSTNATLTLTPLTTLKTTTRQPQMTGSQATITWPHPQPTNTISSKQAAEEDTTESPITDDQVYTSSNGNTAEHSPTSTRLSSPSAASATTSLTPPTSMEDSQPYPNDTKGYISRNITTGDSLRPGGDGGFTPVWHLAANTVLVALATCATIAFGCCCSVLMAVSWRGRRRRKGRYRTTLKGKSGSMRLIKYVIVRESS